MSLFINSKVHLPSSCEKCPFNYADISVGICIAADKTIDTRTYGRKRHQDCPLVEIPTPHGRLIDDFKLLRALIKAFPNQSMNFYDTFERVIDEAPTIIEAEVSQWRSD